MEPTSSPRPEPPAYAELTSLSNFSFLRGASHPEELVERARALGYRALALTDIASLAGVVRAHAVAKDCGLHLILGATFRLADGPALTLLVRNAAGYAALCRLITRARGAADKGHYHLSRADLDTLPAEARTGWHVLLRIEPEIAEPTLAEAAPARFTNGERCLRPRDVGLDPDGALAPQRQTLTAEPLGFPYHESPHAGGSDAHVQSRRSVQESPQHLGVPLQGKADDQQIVDRATNRRFVDYSTDR